MKKIPKVLVDDCIESCRKFWSSGNRSLLYPMHTKAEALAKEIGVDWASITDFISAIVKPHGFYPDAENDEIYCAFRVLGWDVVEEKGGG